VNPRLQALLTNVSESARRHIGALFQQVRVHEKFAGKLSLLGEPIELGGRGNSYELRLFPEVTKQEPIQGKPALDMTFVVFSPTGQLRERRDSEEVTREPGTPNRAFVEMTAELAPFRNDMRDLLDDLAAHLETRWPERKFSHLLTATTAELDLAAVFVGVDSLKQLALDMARVA
jgi:hypothetical protein